MPLSFARPPRPAELWAVVKADAYGHGAVGAARAALEGGASVLCVATAREGEDLREAFPSQRILVMSPLDPGEEAAARDARLELALSSPHVPEGRERAREGRHRHGPVGDDARRSADRAA